MTYKLAAVLLLLVSTGCSASSSVPRASATATNFVPAIATFASSPTQTAAVISSPTSQMGTPMPAATGLNPKMPSAPTTSAPTGWKTFSSASWHVEVDYPPGWTLREEATVVTFSSAQGETIILAPVETGGLAPQVFQSEHQLPNTRCRSTPNVYGVNVRTCFDTISFSYSAEFISKLSSGSEQLLSISIHTRAPDTVQIFNGMVASIRPGS
jgi:hypothetical protein